MLEFQKKLEKAWDEGFFYNLRQGHFNEAQYLEVKNVFLKINTDPDKQVIDKRLVQLLWFTPLFIDWQKERLIEQGVPNPKISEMSNFFFDQCERILGIP